jgi:CheY-like chemotaxis protein
MAQPDIILLIDGEADTREAMRGMLFNEGYAVVTAREGREALRLLLGGLAPCVIVMDLAMAGMNSVEFRREQLRHPSIAAIPFIAYSAVLDVRGRTPARAPGPRDAPAEFQHVLSIIRQHCSH